MHSKAPEIVARAKHYLGRPWRHQGRSWHTGVDCAGLVIKVGHDLKLGAFDTTDYGRRPDLIEFDRCLRVSGCTSVGLPGLENGDIVRISETRWPVHCGIVEYDKHSAWLIHSTALARQVVREPLGEVRWRQITAVWRYPE